MRSFSISEAIKAGWAVFERNRWFVIRLSLIGFGFSIVSNYISNTSKDVGGTTSLVFIFTSFALGILSLLLHIGFTKFGLELVDGKKPELKDLLSHSKLFWKFLGGSILYFLLILAAFLLSMAVTIILSIVFQSKLILIMMALSVFFGLVLATQYFFTIPLIVDQDLGPVEAMKKSAKMTKGSRIDLFAFIVIAVLINILGAICVLVGLLVSVPVTFFAYLYIYRLLAKNA